jgi:hypothetical protein
MEAVAAISTLKYKKYDLTDDSVTFLGLIKRARDLAGYSEMYLTSVVQAVGGLNVYDTLMVSSANFYDELGEAMTYYEILEEIAKYLGCTFTANGTGMFLLDYHAIKGGLNSYHKYVGDTHSSSTLSNSKSITIDDYTGTGAKITRLPGKNKVTVNCSMYEIENIFPDIDKGLIPGINKSTISWKSDHKGSKRNYLVTVGTLYVGNHDDITTYGGPIGGKGSTLTKATRYVEGNVPNKLGFDTEVRVRYYTDMASISDHLTTSDPILKMKSRNPIFAHDGVFFSFSCDAQANIEGTTHTSQDGLIMDEPWNTASADTEWPIPLKLRIGEYYYNGSAWSKTDSKFNAYLEIKKDEKKFGRFLTVKDENEYTLGIGDLSGCIINPPSTTIYGDMELTIYAPWPIDFNAGGNYGVKWLFMKNIKLDYAIQDTEGIFDFSEKKKEDTIYESTIDSTYIEEADDIELKICTNVGGKLALSSVIVDGDFLETLYFRSLSVTGVPEEVLIARALSVYSSPRYNLSLTLNNGYPPHSLISDPHLPGVKFIIAGGEEDVKMESTTYNLIEI